MLLFLQYNLGDGLITMMSQTTYNDNKWHTVDAVRQGETGVLSMDGVQVFQDSAPGIKKQLNVSILLLCVSIIRINNWTTY